jgi:hypothetical protein
VRSFISSKTHFENAPPGVRPHVQLQELVVVRRVGEREAAPLAFLQQDVDVLPGEELQALAGRKLEVEDGDLVGHLLDALDAARHRADGEVLGARELAHLEHDVAHRPRAARERLARGLSRPDAAPAPGIRRRRARPARSMPLHAPQAPLRQPYGRPMFWRSAASRRVSPGATLNVWPLGSSRTVRADAGVSANVNGCGGTPRR